MTQWRNKISVKEHLSEDTSDKAVLTVAKALVPQLEWIINLEEKRIENKRGNALDEYFVDEFKELAEEFKWIIEMIEKEEDPSEYSYDNWCEAFNNYLSGVYDMGDVITGNYNSFNKEKFLWVG